MKNIFLTACILSSISVFSQTTVIWSENFDDTTLLPTNWTQETFATDGGWLVNTDGIASSSYFEIPDADSLVLYTNDDDCNCDKSNDLIKLPEFDLVSVDNPYLMFDLFYLDATYTGNSETLELLTTVNGGIDWVVQTTFSGAYEWQTMSIALDEFAGGDVQVALRYNDGGGWLFGAAIDNMMLVDVDPTDVDASLSNGNVGVYVDAVPTVVANYSKYTSGSDVVPVITITNESIAPITSFQVSFNTGGTAVAETVNAIFVGMGESYTHTFDEVVTIPSGLDTIYFNLLQVNGAGDNNPDNNAAQSTYEGVTPNTNKMVVAEMGTGTWCGWCPRGAVYMDYLEEKYPDNFIGLSVHNDDPMEVTEYDAAIGNSISGYPAALVDRAEFDGSDEVNVQDMERAIMERITDNDGTHVEAFIELFDAFGANVHAQVHFDQELTGTYKAAVVLVEDEVSGSGLSWAQNNYYAGGANGPMGGFENLAEVIPANSIQYDHVVRSVIGGWAGADSASIPTPDAGDMEQWRFFVPINSTWNVDHLRAVVLLINSINGEIVNAGISDYLSVGVDEVEEQSAAFSLFPNPAADITYVRLSKSNKSDAVVRIFDATGQLVVEKNYTAINDEQMIPLHTSNLAAGCYTVSVISETAVMNKTLVVSR